MLKTRASTEVAHVKATKKSRIPLPWVGLEPCETAFYKDLSSKIYSFSTFTTLSKLL